MPRLLSGWSTDTRRADGRICGTSGQSLVKSNGDGKYRGIYLWRKQREREIAEAKGLTVAPSAKIPKSQSEKYMSHGHIDKRAQRYMEKCLLRDLWQAWRVGQFICAETDMVALPPANERLSEEAA